MLSQHNPNFHSVHLRESISFQVRVIDSINALIFPPEDLEEEWPDRCSGMQKFDTKQSHYYSIFIKFGYLNVIGCGNSWFSSTTMITKLFPVMTLEGLSLEFS